MKTSFYNLQRTPTSQFTACLPVRAEAHASLIAFAELPLRSPQHENKLHLWLYEAAQTYIRVRIAQSEAETNMLADFLYSL